MVETDTERDFYTQMMTPTPAEFDFNADSSMGDHDLLINHVAQHDHEMYGLDCCLSELLRD